MKVTYRRLFITRTLKPATPSRRGALPCGQSSSEVCHWHLAWTNSRAGFHLRGPHPSRVPEPPLPQPPRGSPHTDRAGGPKWGAWARRSAWCVPCLLWKELMRTGPCLGFCRSAAEKPHRPVPLAAKGPSLDGIVTPPCPSAQGSPGSRPASYALLASGPAALPGPSGSHPVLAPPPDGPTAPWHTGLLRAAAPCPSRCASPGRPPPWLQDWVTRWWRCRD